VGDGDPAQGGAALLYVAVFIVVIVLLEIFVRYDRYVSMLKWLTLALFAYPAVAFVVHVPWLTVGYHLVVPSISWNVDYFTVVVAILGTTISPYLFFWQDHGDDYVAGEPIVDHGPLSASPDPKDHRMARDHSDGRSGRGHVRDHGRAVVLGGSMTRRCSMAPDRVEKPVKPAHRWREARRTKTISVDPSSADGERAACRSRGRTSTL
jgi:hypothetical protein